MSDGERQGERGSSNPTLDLGKSQTHYTATPKLWREQNREGGRDRGMGGVEKERVEKKERRKMSDGKRVEGETDRFATLHYIIVI